MQVTTKTSCAEDFDRQYDLTPLSNQEGGGSPSASAKTPRTPTTPSYSIDPWELASPEAGPEDSSGHFRLDALGR
jgi:hypothetical protein